MLTLICGLPNAGKTTYSERFSGVIHQEDTHDYDLCCYRASQVQGNVCVDGIFEKAEQRRMLIERCRHQHPKVCIWIDTPLEECVERERSYRKRSVGMILLINSLWERPTHEEGWDEVIHIKG